MTTLDTIPPVYVQLIAHWLVDATDYLNLSHTCSRFLRVMREHTSPMRVSNYECRPLTYLAGVTNWSMGVKSLSPGRMNLPASLTELKLTVRTHPDTWIKSEQLSALVNLKKLICPQLMVGEAAMGCNDTLESLVCGKFMPEVDDDPRTFPLLTDLLLRRGSRRWNVADAPESVLKKLRTLTDMNCSIETLLLVMDLQSIITQFVHVSLNDFLYIGEILITPLDPWTIMQNKSKYLLTCPTADKVFRPLSATYKNSPIVLCITAEVNIKKYQQCNDAIKILYNEQVMKMLCGLLAEQRRELA